MHALRPRPGGDLRIASDGRGSRKRREGPRVSAGPFGFRPRSDGQPTIALRAFIGRTLIFRVAGFAFTVIISPGLKGFGFS